METAQTKGNEKQVALREPMLVQCKTQRCVAVLEADGKWRHYFTGVELAEPVTPIQYIAAWG